MATNVLLYPKMIILSRLHAVISSVKQNEETLLSSYWLQVVKLQKSPIKVPSNPYDSGAIYSQSLKLIALMF